MALRADGGTGEVAAVPEETIQGGRGSRSPIPGDAENRSSFLSLDQLGFCDITRALSWMTRYTGAVR
jgi:hypothetical protein